MNKRRQRLYAEFKIQLLNDLYEETQDLMQNPTLYSFTDLLIAEGLNTLVTKMMVPDLLDEETDAYTS